MSDIDLTYKKEIEYIFRKLNMRFCVSQMLFGSQKVDVGTHHLLRSIELQGIDLYSKVLDLGSGYGPIGISLNKFLPSSEVHMVDKDSLAIEYCKVNAQLNGVKGVKIYESLGYDDIVDTDFDLIVSNIPAKVGDKVLTYLLTEAEYYLRPGGQVMIVVIDAIVQHVTRVLTDNENIRIFLQKKWPGYTVFQYEFLKYDYAKQSVLGSAFDRGIFDRERIDFIIGNNCASILTTCGLSEFNSLGFDTQLLLNELETIQGKTIKEALVFNPGQGYIPLSAVFRAQVENISLVDRNLQALRTTRRNLILNGYPDSCIRLLNQPDLSMDSNIKFDCIMGMFEVKELQGIHEQLLKQAINLLNRDGFIILGSSSTVITRLEKTIQESKAIQKIERHKSKGNSVVILKLK